MEAAAKAAVGLARGRCDETQVKLSLRARGWLGACLVCKMLLDFPVLIGKQLNSQGPADITM